MVDARNSRYGWGRRTSRIQGEHRIMGLGTALWEELAADLPGSVEIARIAVRLPAAIVLGGLLGFQRAEAGKAAGTRTHVLVTLGAALVVLLPSLSGMSGADSSRIMQGIVTGIGFIGGGVILKLSQQHRIEGVTTAAGIWLTATVGIAAGAGRLGLALSGTLLAYVVLTVVGRLEDRMITYHPAGKSDPGETAGAECRHASRPASQRWSPARSIPTRRAGSCGSLDHPQCERGEHSILHG
jgi:putative Mg2+ transporter-C (MgtC) family protein